MTESERDLLSKTWVEKMARKGFRRGGQPKCLYADSEFVLVKWPAVKGTLRRGDLPPRVVRYESPRLKELAEQENFLYSGVMVWNCRRNMDGPLTRRRLAVLITREQQKSVE